MGAPENSAEWFKGNGIIFRQSMLYALSFTFLLWVIKGYEGITGNDLGYLGIFPRTLKGVIGIVTSPLIHGDSFHLLSNTFPIIMLGAGLFYFYNEIAKKVFILIYFLTSLSVWMVARQAYHIGASGLIYGLLSFLFFIGLFRKDSASMTISLIVLLLYSGMLGGLFPADQRISYESHIMGSFVGLAIAFFYRNSAHANREEDQEDENTDDPPEGFSEPTHTYEGNASFKCELKKK